MKHEIILKMTLNGKEYSSKHIIEETENQLDAAKRIGGSVTNTIGHYTGIYDEHLKNS